MSKELEQVLKAYNEVEEFISEMPLSYKGYNNLGVSEYISDRLNEIEEALNEYVELKKALTPPTADEVCEALSENYNKEVIIDKRYKNTVFAVKRGSNIAYMAGNKLQINQPLPPHFVELVAKYYKGESK